MSPWAPRRPLAGHWLDAFAQVEEALAGRGIPVSAYIDSEIAEVAAMIGANSEPGEDDAPDEGEADPLELLASGVQRPW